LDEGAGVLVTLSNVCFKLLSKKEVEALKVELLNGC
jgi:hypothetical protein